MISPTYSVISEPILIDFYAQNKPFPRAPADLTIVFANYLRYIR